MQKLTKKDGSTPDMVEANIEQLREVFPEVFIDGKIDFDALKDTLGDYLDDREERYSFTWHGKSNAKRIAQTPSTGTLLPRKEESVNWDTTRNIFIEGDNLEVLKVLQKSYHRKVKMIYIDPPYNTGKEFIYPDKWQDNLDTYLRYTGQVDNEGFKISANSETSGRYHTNWLNMMYPRLKLARNLLRDDGVVFVSIDDHEIHNLRHLMDEVYGPENFLCQFVWNTEGHTDNQYEVKVNHEYICAYRRSGATQLGFVVDPNTNSESNVWKGFAENSITKNGSANPPSVVTLPAGFPSTTESLSLEKNEPLSDFFDEVEAAGYITRSLTQKWEVTYPIRLDKMEIEQGKLVNECRVYSGWANVNKLKDFIANNCHPLDEGDSILTFYLSDRGVIYYRREREKTRNIFSVLRNFGTTERMRSELESLEIPFQYPKPKELLAYLLKMGLPEGGIVLDFFAGSGTTGQALSSLQISEDVSESQYILVQLPEKFDENDAKQRPSIDFCDSVSQPRSIATICKERLRRMPNSETGFKAFKLCSSNIKPWDADFEKIQESLFDAIENIKPDRTQEDVLYELLLKFGLDLATPVEERAISDKSVFIVGAGALVVCLDDNINLDQVRDIAALKEELKPEIMRVVFKDSGFQNDVVKTNAVQILNQAGIDDVKSL